METLLHRLLCGHGIDNRVLDAASILVDRRFRRGKTDRLDVAALLHQIDLVAQALLVHGTLTGDQLKAIVAPVETDGLSS